MPITWFPGHMLTARKKAAETMRRTDLVIEVLDARVPLAAATPLFERLRRAGQTPALKLLNKSDMADPGADAALARPLQRAARRARRWRSPRRNRARLRRMLPACQALLPDRERRTSPCG